MLPILPPHAAALALLCSAGAALAAEKVLIIGDSLSKEYEIEWLGIGGDPFSKPVENWCEILDNRRGAWFEFGGSGTYEDWRVAGHEYNWSLPGSETSAWRGMLADAPGDLTDQLKHEVNRVVIFLGGNDVRVKYQDLYDGKPAAEWISTTYGNIAYVLDFVRTQNPALPVVLVNVPHLGCTPNINGDHPYDPVKTARVTAALDDLNSRIAALTRERGIGLADIYSMTLELVTAPRWVISGWKVEKTSSGSGEPNALFLGDGFHPNMPAQAVFAQRIVDAFNDRYDSGIPRLGSREILVDVLQVDADMTLARWAQSFGLLSEDRDPADDPEGDTIRNIVEYALDLDPLRADNQHLPQPVVIGNNLTLTWQPRDPGGAHSALIVQESADLKIWTAVPANSIANLEFNTLRVSRPITPDQPLWLRFQATEIK
ncbi:MAG: SGNH/GDSL hydrolase family protein [Verrucomicrobiota bacterium]